MIAGTISDPITIRFPVVVGSENRRCRTDVVHAVPPSRTVREAPSISNKAVCSGACAWAILPVLPRMAVSKASRSARRRETGRACLR